MRTHASPIFVLQRHASYVVASEVAYGPGSHCRSDHQVISPSSPCPIQHSGLSDLRVIETRAGVQIGGVQARVESQNVHGLMQSGGRYGSE